MTMKKEKTITIYNDDLCAYIDAYNDDIIASLKDNDADINDNNIFEEARRMTDADFDDLRYSLGRFDKNNNCNVYASASLGLWYGRVQAHRIFANLQDAVQSCFEDVNAVYFDNKRCTLTLRATHHDGENIIKFYKIIQGKKRAITYADIYGGY